MKKVLLLIFTFLFSICLFAEEDDVFETLRKNGIEVTIEGLTSYLNSFDDINSVIDSSIVQLGDDEYKTRILAHSRLLDIGAQAISKLEKATQSNDLEVSWRALHILNDIKTKPNRLNVRACAIIALGNYVDKSSFQYIIEICKSTNDPAIKHACAVSLKNYNNKVAADVIYNSIKTEKNHFVKIKILEILVSFEDDAIFEPIKNLLCNTKLSNDESKIIIERLSESMSNEHLQLLFSLINSKNDFIALKSLEALQTFKVTDKTAELLINKIINGNTDATKHLTNAIVKSNCEKAHTMLIDTFRKLIKDDQNKAYIMSFVIPECQSKTVIDNFVKIILSPETNSNIKKNGLLKLAAKADELAFVRDKIVSILNNNKLETMEKYRLVSSLCKYPNKQDVRKTILNAFNSFENDLYKWKLIYEHYNECDILFVPFLLEVLSDKSNSKRANALSILKSISGENYNYKIEEWNQWFIKYKKEHM